ncbi:MAG: class I mannose-6-phosphate isomerase [Bacteroidales bacterium]|nr:class I mannose-6-phosphate isomerase [Bacteroidales bacterium]
MPNLYPLKFKPIYKDKIWGGDKIRTLLNKDFSPLPNCGESWEISGVEKEISIVKNGFLATNNLQELIEVYMGDLIGDHIYYKFGDEFPLLIKFIDANDDLSIQVHPNDYLSKERHNAFGKTEMWYIIDADRGAQLISGFNKKLTKKEYIQHLKNNTVEKILNYEKVKQGDVFFMPSGRIHAIGSGILLAEIQQTSDITYRIYDYNRKGTDGKPRELHTGLALDAIDFNFYKNYRTDYENQLNEFSNIIKCDYFIASILEFNKSINKDYNLIDSFVIYICLEGDIEIIDQYKNNTRLEKGETILIPAILKDITLNPKQKSKILEIYVE